MMNNKTVSGETKMTSDELFKKTQEATLALARAFNILAKDFDGPIMPCALALITYDLFKGENGAKAKKWYDRTMDTLIAGNENGTDA
jgi:hypothetical protein